MNPARLPVIVLTGECTPEEASEMADLLLQAKTRRTDPATSKDAAESVLGMTGKRLAVLRLFEACGPMTDEEVLERYRSRVGTHGIPEQSVSGLRTRRSELVRMGQIEDAGYTRTMSTGRQATVWAEVQR